MAPFIEMAIGDAKEPRVLPEKEYELKVLKVSVGLSSGRGGKEKRNQMVLMLGVPGYVTKPIYYYLGLETAHLDDAAKNMRYLETKALCKMFNVPFDADGFNSDDFIGADGVGLLQVENSDEYGESNKLKVRF
jgi:hypothetical protein